LQHYSSSLKSPIFLAFIDSREVPKYLEMASLRLFTILLLAMASITGALRLPPGLEEPSRLIRPFDTSNYGKLQLNNGLALTPQMGYVLLSLQNPILRVGTFDILLHWY
jgi:hypothetical protein